MTLYRVTTIVAYRSQYIPKAYSYRCGWGGRRCRAYYAVSCIQSYTLYHLFVYYSIVPHCCPGYDGNPPTCHSVCSHGCLNGGTCSSPEECTCALGWTGKNCEQDINECQTDNGGCTQKCDNTDGSYQCSCWAGYELISDNHTCVVSEGSCTITPVKPTTLMAAGGVLQDGMENVTMRCICNEGNDDVRWFYPDGSILHDYYITPRGYPYFIQNHEDVSFTMVIPTFNYSFAGPYTCGIGSWFPPRVMAIIDLKVDTSIQQCSVDTITINSIGGYRRAKCTCFDQNGETVQRRQKWFFPNGDVVKNVKQYDSPYSVHRKYVSTLIIPWSTNSSYYGIYTCGIEKGVFSIVNTVEVRFIENIEPVIHLRMMNQTYKNEETAVFTCQATGKPVPLIEWYFNDIKVDEINSTNYILSSPISGDYILSTLIILNATWLDKGTYTCNASNVAGSITSSGQLTINDAAVITKIFSPHQNSSVFSTTSMTCDAKGYPPPQINWILRNEVVKNDSNTIITYNDHCPINDYDRKCVSSSTVFISNTLPFHNAMYSCMAINSAGKSTESSELTITVPPPEMIIHPRSKEINLTQTATFTCSATGYNVGYEWIIGSGYQKMHFPSKVVGVNTNTLVIPNVRSSYNGTYTCVASNIGGTVYSYAALLTVTGLPEVKVTPSNQTVEVTHTAIFTAIVSGVGVENFKYQWIHNGINITGETGNSLIITNVMESDSGDYECIVTNEYGDVTILPLAVNLVVYVTSPVIPKPPEDINIMIYGVASFQCVADGYNISISWQKDDTKLPRMSTVTESRNEHNVTSVLRIVNTIGYYAGNYCCIAENEGGKVSSCAELTVKVPPPEIIKPPEMITVKQGADAVFDCFAVSHGKLKYDWKLKDSKSLPSSARKSFTIGRYLGQQVVFSRLTIPNVKQSYGKDYYCCLATTEGGTTKECASLRVY